MEIIGDTPEAPCYGIKNKDPYRDVQHKWENIGNNVEVCKVCGGMRKLNEK